MKVRWDGHAPTARALRHMRFRDFRFVVVDLANEVAGFWVDWKLHAGDQGMMKNGSRLDCTHLHFLSPHRSTRGRSTCEASSSRWEVEVEVEVGGWGPGRRTWSDDEHQVISSALVSESRLLRETFSRDAGRGEGKVTSTSSGHQVDHGGSESSVAQLGPVWQPKSQ